MSGYFLKMLLAWKETSIKKKIQPYLDLYEHQYRVQLWGVKTYIGFYKKVFILYVADFFRPRRICQDNIKPYLHIWRSWKVDGTEFESCSVTSYLLHYKTFECI
jgi:hypothetical protein